MILLGLKFRPKVIFWGVYERRRDFFCWRKKTEGFGGLQKKGLRDLFGYAIKRSDLFG